MTRPRPRWMSTRRWRTSPAPRRCSSRRTVTGSPRSPPSRSGSCPPPRCRSTSSTPPERSCAAPGPVVRSRQEWCPGPGTAGSPTAAWAPRGSYRFVVRATNGAQSAAVSATVLADAFRVTTSTAIPGPRLALHRHGGHAPKACPPTPIITIRQPGLSAWKVTMTKVSSTTWKATIRPKTGGSAGTLSLSVRAEGPRRRRRTRPSVRLRLRLGGDARALRDPQPDTTGHWSTSPTLVGVAPVG